ncbi:ABC transporter permease [Bacteroidales bacterium OttesenSCG-928-B11]|nr:ABC transporter permease [Bacteroidales bacterium OttesenSCG-928-C03]MDL2311438.1 ABC transporter permease [Bacteroidales bacterium OttesenSCG-928-B11]
MLRYLLEKEIKLFFRNPFLPKLVALLPFIALAIFPLVANLDIKDLKIAVIDQDKSPYSRQLVEKVLSSPYFQLSGNFTNYAEAQRSVEDDRSDLIMEIPAYFERDLVKEGNVQVFVAINAVDGMKGGMGGSYLTGILTDFNNNIRAEWIQTPSRLSTPHINVFSAFRFNPTLRYIYFMIPALIVMILAMFSGFLPALNIVEEKENGTIEQMNVTPVKKSTFILSKLIPYWVIGFLIVNVCVLVAWLFYGFWLRGSLLTLYPFTIIFTFTFCGLGLVVSNYANALQQAMIIMFFFITTFIFLSGLFTPFDNMPQWAQVIGNISPLKYIIQVTRMVYLKGAVFTEMLPQFAALCLQAVFFNGWAILSYRKRN